MDEPNAGESFFIFDVSDVQIVVPCLHRGNSWMTHHGVCSSMQEEGDAIADIDSSWNDIAVSSSCQVCWFWILRWDTAWMTNWLTDWDSLKCCLRQLCWGHRFQRRCVWHIAIRVGTSQVVSSPPMGEPHCLISPMSHLSEWVDSDAQADLAWTRCARHIYLDSQLRLPGTCLKIWYMLVGLEHFLFFPFPSGRFRPPSSMAWHFIFVIQLSWIGLIRAMIIDWI